MKKILFLLAFSGTNLALGQLSFGLSSGAYILQGKRYNVERTQGEDIFKPSCNMYHTAQLRYKTTENWFYSIGGTYLPKKIKEYYFEQKKLIQYSEWKGYVTGLTLFVGKTFGHSLRKDISFEPHAGFHIVMKQGMRVLYNDNRNNGFIIDYSTTPETKQFWNLHSVENRSVVFGLNTVKTKGNIDFLLTTSIWYKMPLYNYNKWNIPVYDKHGTYSLTEDNFFQWNIHAGFRVILK